MPSRSGARSTRGPESEHLMPKRATIRIDAEMLGSLLGLPNDLAVLHVVVDDYGLALGLVVTADDMVDTPAEYVAPRLSPLYQVDRGTVRIVGVDYPREQGNASAEQATVLPAEYFDELVTSDEPPEANSRVREAARHLPTIVSRQP